MARSANSYAGKLTPAQVATGINVAAANARRLAADASALVQQGRFPSATALAILAIEESGKVSVLRQISLATSPEALRPLWRAYRTHTEKNAHWRLPQLAINGASRLEEFRPLFDGDSPHRAALDETKQLALYSDCLVSAQWSQPETAIPAETAASLVAIAQLLAPKNDVTEQEIELWVKHLGGTDMRDMAGSKKALIDWYSAMQQAGLKAAGENQMERFIEVGVRVRET